MDTIYSNKIKTPISGAANNSKASLILNVSSLGVFASLEPIIKKHLEQYSSARVITKTTL